MEWWAGAGHADAACIVAGYVRRAAVPGPQADIVTQLAARADAAAWLDAGSAMSRDEIVAYTVRELRSRATHATAGASIDTRSRRR